MIEKTFLFRESMSKLVMVMHFLSMLLHPTILNTTKKWSIIYISSKLIYLDMEKMQVLHPFVLLLH